MTDGGTETGTGAETDGREQVEKDLKRYKTLLSNSSDVILHIDEDGTVLYENASRERVFRYEPEEAVGDNVFEYVHPEDRDDVVQRFWELLSGDEETAESVFRLESTEGGYAWAEAAAKDLTDTEVGGVVVSIRDVTERKEREKELEQYEMFIENSSDVITHLGEDGTMLYQSPGTQHIFGHEPGVNLGDNVFKYVHPDDRARVLEGFVEALEDPETENESFEFRLEDDNEGYVWVEAAGTDQRDTEVGGVVITLRDISERKERERKILDQQRVLETVLSNVPIVVFEFDDEGVFTRSEGMALEEIGLERNEAVGRSVFEMYGDTPKINEDVERALAGERVRTTHRVQGRVFETWLEPLKREGELSDILREGERVEGVVGLAYDITEREEKEGELEAYKQELERSNEHLEQFAYVASHDLKEPLRMVSGYLELLADEYGEEIDDEADEYIGFAVDGAERMREMIDALLKYSRVGAQEGEFKQIDTETVLEDVLRDLKHVVKRNNAEVTYDDLPTVEADAEQLTHVFQNLVKNAVEHGSGKTDNARERAHAFEVRVGAEELEDGHEHKYEFYVADEGVGIPESRQDDIFEIFEQGGRENSDGTGIGLAVCARIVEGHGGNIWVESAEGEGTTFRFTLPKKE